MSERKKVMIAYQKKGKWFYKISEDGGKTYSEEKEVVADVLHNFLDNNW